MPGPIVPPAAPGDNAAARTELSFEHLQEAHDAFYDRGKANSYFQQPEVERGLLDAYARGPDRTVNKHNYRTITDYMRQARSAEQETSSKILGVQPGLSNWAHIDPGTGRLTNNDPTKSLSDAMYTASAEQAYMVPLYNDEDFDRQYTPVVGHAAKILRGAGTAIGDIGIGNWRAKWLMKKFGVGVGVFDEDKDFDKWYQRLLYQGEQEDGLGWLTHEIGRMIPLLLLTRVMPGSASSTSGKYLLNSGYAGNFAAHAMNLGLASGAMAPVTYAFNPETNQREMGYIGPEGKFNELGFLDGLKGQGISAAIGGIAGGVSSVTARWLETWFAKKIGSLAPTGGQIPAKYNAAKFMKGTANFLQEVNAFTMVGSGWEYIDSGDLRYWDHFKSNAVLFGTLKGLGHGYRATGFRSGKVKMGADGIPTITPRTGIKKWLWNRTAEQAGMPGAKEPTYRDKIGVMSETLRRAELEGASIKDLVEGYKEAGAHSRLGQYLRAAGFSPNYSPMDIYLAKTYAEAGLTYDGVHAKKLLEAPNLVRDAVIAGQGHSQFLEGSQAAARAKAKMAESLKEQGVGTDSPDTFWDLHHTAKLPEQGPRKAGQVEMEFMADNNVGPSNAPEARAQIGAAKAHESQRRARVKMLEKLETIVGDLALGETIQVDPRLKETVRVYEGLADNYGRKAEKSLNTLEKEIKDTVQKAHKAAERVGKVVEAKGKELSGHDLESTQEQETRLRGLEEIVATAGDAQNIKAVPHKIVKAFEKGTRPSRDLYGSLRWAWEAHPEAVKEAVRKAKKNPELIDAVLRLRSRYNEGRMTAEQVEAMRRTGGQKLNDVSIAIEEAGRVLMAFPKTSKGVFVGGWKATGNARRAVTALSTYLFQKGVHHYGAWKAEMTKRTAAKLHDDVWRTAFKQDKARWKDHLKKVVGGLRSYDDLKRLVKAEAESANWYADFEATFRPLFSENGKPNMVEWTNSRGEKVQSSFYDLFTNVLSATSSNTKVSGNVAKAVHALVEILQSGHRSNFTQRRTFEVVRVDNSKSPYRIVDAETGEIMVNQPIYRGKTFEGQRTTKWKERKLATVRANQLNNKEVASKPSLQRDQIKALKEIIENGRIPEDGTAGMRKRANFAANLQGNANAVTMDVWAMRAMGWYKKIGSTGQPKLNAEGKVMDNKPTQWMYDHYEVLVKEMAASLGWTPREVQAAMWSAIKTEWTLKKWGGADARPGDFASYEPYVMFKLLAKGRFRRAAGVDYKKLAQSHPEILATMLKEGIAPEILKTSMDLTPKVELEIRKRFKHCFR